MSSCSTLTRCAAKSHIIFIVAVFVVDCCPYKQTETVMFFYNTLRRVIAAMRWTRVCAAVASQVTDRQQGSA